MGQNPAKFFPMPTPFGQAPDANVLQKAQSAPLAPPQNFLPLNQTDSGAAQQPIQQQGPDDNGISRPQFFQARYRNRFQDNEL